MSKQSKYHKFTVVESARRTDQARATPDATSPSLDALRGKLGGKVINLKQCKGKVEFKRAIPKSKVLDGSSSSKRLIVKQGKVIGAQG
jgi:hypothetical protein